MSVIRRHPVITFFLLAYALSWAAIPWQSFFAPGVLVAALIVVSLTEGVAGLKAMGSRLIRWRVSWIWYALALGVPLAGDIRGNRPEHRFWRTRPGHRRVQRLVRPANGDCHKHGQPPQRPAS
jgi:hypothetical protein